MKIRDLDRNEVYSLEEIKKDSVKFDLLKEWLRENERNWSEFNFEELNESICLRYNIDDKEWLLSNKNIPTKCALTLFELDITDYQVDCTDLSKEQIEEMGSVLLLKGKDYLSSKKFALSRNHNSDFLISSDESFYITNKQDDKTTITYDKFIELFGEKPLNGIDVAEKIVNNEWIQSDFGQYKLTEQGLVFHDDFDLELYKEIGGLSKPKSIKQSSKEFADAFTYDSNSIVGLGTKPSQYQIGIDTFTRAESNMIKEEILACVRFNIDKYTWRKKGQDKQDLEKIISYAQWGLKQLND